MAAQGQLPITSLVQRERNRQTTETDYSVPSALRSALRFGYVSPNLQPPEGMVWRVRSGKWHLGLRGG
eukprot:5194785-Amphidinium_carterae.1